MWAKSAHTLQHFLCNHHCCGFVNPSVQDVLCDGPHVCVRPERGTHTCVRIHTQVMGRERCSCAKCKVAWEPANEVKMRKVYLHCKALLVSPPPNTGKRSHVKCVKAACMHKHVSGGCGSVRFYNIRTQRSYEKWKHTL